MKNKTIKIIVYCFVGLLICGLLYFLYSAINTYSIYRMKCGAIGLGSKQCPSGYTCVYNNDTAISIEGPTGKCQKK